jgi:predicted membrane channel-forming protein YqfA (hemolysin III family)
MDQLPQFLLPAVIAFQAILFSLFGNLLSIYHQYQNEAAPISSIIRKLMYFHTGIIILSTIIGFYALFLLECKIPMWVSMILTFIILYMPAMAITMTYTMWKDCR